MRFGATRCRLASLLQTDRKHTGHSVCWPPQQTLADGTFMAEAESKGGLIRAEAGGLVLSAAFIIM